jgi:hypothetical protein
MRSGKNLGDAAKVVALCLPPVILSLIGLAVMSRREAGQGQRKRREPPAAARGPSAPVAGKASWLSRRG